MILLVGERKSLVKTENMLCKVNESERRQNPLDSKHFVNTKVHSHKNGCCLPEQGLPLGQ